MEEVGEPRPVPLGDWAPAPTPPKVTELVPTSRDRSIPWRYTTTQPSGTTGPARLRRRAAGSKAPAASGRAGTPGIRVATTWNTPDIWLRREVTLPAATDPARLQLLLYHDEDVEVYIDGVLAAREPGYVTTYEPIEINAAARAQLKPGAKVVLAVHCHQTGGGQGVDLGLVDVREGRRTRPPMIEFGCDDRRPQRSSENDAPRPERGAGVLAIG